MKKFVKRGLVTLVAVTATITLGLATTTVVNVVASEIEKEAIEPYGTFVTVDGHRMNVVITGSGPTDIVLLPGFGTASPAIDFSPLVNDLATDYRVVVIEPLGYGLSDGTERARTTENIVAEVHDALEQLDIDSYVLMGHSIAGIYALELAAKHPEELRGFVGIDTSVPGQPHMDTEFPTGLMGAARTLGLARLLLAVGSVGHEGGAYSDHDREQIAMISHRTSMAPTYLDEMAHIAPNFAQAEGRTFPDDLPVLLFAVADNEKNPDWVALHEAQAASVADGTVIPVDGDHYLHHTHAAEIADAFRSWAAERMPFPQ
ncbi:alpha/beta hydrolase [Microbacterium sp. kSW2-24]|uniref:alpha/beta fold hydrolase n=1 Tax=Microbacterium galbinum TaxID=2851646 RepID=UPI001FFD6C10|nr:alpha/beta hydrolase [Microbacterium galbinum]MCK2021701.1 alpha/beta hydrolase [Microbacterium galbinum]